MKNSPFVSLILTGCLVFYGQPVVADGCGKPSFTAGRVLAAGDSSGFTAVADFNGNGKPDLAFLFE